MYGSQYYWSELHDSILAYKGPQTLTDLLLPWIEQHAATVSELRQVTSRLATFPAAASDEDLCLLYAVFRSTSLLLLRFQQGRADGTDYPGPAITPADFQFFHECLGFQVATADCYHPLYHEIVRVNESDDAATVVTVDTEHWPCLMAGDLLFCRAGCTIRAGRDHIVKEIAEASRLYWTYRRKDRRHHDQSQGWGSNSQWRTRLRRDYRLANGFAFNVDGQEPITDLAGNLDDLPATTMLELLRHRCLIKSVADDGDLYPYWYCYTELICGT